VYINLFFICFFFTLVFLLKCSRWRQACLARRHLLHPRKKLRNDYEPLGLSSSATLEKKQKDDNELGRLTIICYFWKKKTKKKTKKWRWAKEVRFHLLHLKKNAKDDDQLGSSRLIVISWVFSQLWAHWLHRHLMHLLVSCDLTNCITTWCISWVFVISLIASPPDASLTFLWSC